jgi:Zn-dependent protease
MTPLEAPDQDVRWEFSFGAAALIAMILLIGILRFGLAAGTLGAFLFLFSLFAHEAGHALMARAFRVPYSAVGICFKGVYLRRRCASGWGKESAIAFAGPLVNLILALCFWQAGTIGNWLGQINLFLFVFNLLPIRGTDGRRILIALKQMNTRHPAMDVG